MTAVPPVFVGSAAGSEGSERQERVLAITKAHTAEFLINIGTQIIANNSIPMFRAPHITIYHRSNLFLFTKWFSCVPFAS